MIPNRQEAWKRWASGAALAAAVLPGLALAPSRGNLLPPLLAVLAAGAGTFLANHFTPRPRGWLALLGVLMVALAVWLAAQIHFALTAYLVATVLGAGLGLTLPPWRRLAGGWPAAALAALLLLVLWRLSLPAALAAGGILVVVNALVPSVSRSPGLGAGVGARVSLALCLVLASLLTTGWVGASTARANWFGATVDHGPRAGNEVAITFDDGPNAVYSLKIRDILDRYGVKATFFTVGKALDQRPDISRALLADGMLLGDHSYHHDSTSWLDPLYPEIPETQASFQRQLGVCPAFFRPPHGTHTPFMAHVAAERGMTMITWDVSAGDWATTDGQLVAQRVLAQVRPGSIILLHDSIDGNVNADRSVMLTALPLILDGLKATGLQPVRLDQLLGKPGYVPCRPGG
ncbi:MAG TPA: polysaccharide deacetylase family protein [Thermomicrobiaceae bacterium]|nr:polysaccharide deacetylase family protein [Thermomicrobiaceae bacterium]